MTEEKKPEELNLTVADRQLLDSLRTFPLLDKGSQNRMRAKVDARRKESKDFDTAFGMSLGSAFRSPQKPQETSIFSSMKNVKSPNRRFKRQNRGENAQIKEQGTRNSGSPTPNPLKSGRTVGF